MKALTARSLRLWHWQKVVSFRSRATETEKIADAWEQKHRGRCRSMRNRARDAHRNANFHLGAVQVLNDQFSVGDTADRDLRMAMGSK
jgi:hypothetical protein